MDEFKQCKPHNWSLWIYKLVLTSLPAVQLDFHLHAGALSAQNSSWYWVTAAWIPQMQLTRRNHIILLILIIIDQSLWKSSLNSVEGVRWQGIGRFSTALLPKITAKVFTKTNYFDINVTFLHCQNNLQAVYEIFRNCNGLLKTVEDGAFDHSLKVTSVSEMQCDALTWQRRFSFPRTWTPSL